VVVGGGWLQGTKPDQALVRQYVKYQGMDSLLTTSFAPPSTVTRTPTWKTGTANRVYGTDGGKFARVSIKPTNPYPQPSLDPYPSPYHDRFELVSCRLMWCGDVTCGGGVVVVGLASRSDHQRVRHSVVPRRCAG
jgi:hypothetical protein